MLTLRLPEIEVPSCAATLGKSDPELFANKDAKGNITHANILCAGKPGIYDTVSAHIDEIIDMFPHASYMHIGGDEAAVDIWKNWWDKSYAYASSITVQPTNQVIGRYTLFLGAVPVSKAFIP